MLPDGDVTSSNATEPTTRMLIMSAEVLSKIGPGGSKNRGSLGSTSPLSLARALQNQLQLLLRRRRNLFRIRQNCMRQRRPAFARALLRRRRHGGAHHLRRVLSILQQHSHDLIPRHRVVMRMPAVIIRHHRDGHIAKLGLARQLRFLQVGHADHVHAHPAIHIRFRSRRKLRPFHAQIGSAALAHHAGLLARGLHHRRQFSTHRLGKRNVGHHAATEKRIHTMPRAIEKLIGNHKLQRFMLFLQRSHGRNRNDPLHPELFEPVNIRAKIQLAGQNAVPAPMPRQKRHLAPFQRPAHVGVRRRPKRRLHPHLFHPAQPGHRIQPAAPDDPNLRLCHRSPRKDHHPKPNLRLYKTLPHASACDQDAHVGTAAPAVPAREARQPLSRGQRTESSPSSTLPLPINSPIFRRSRPDPLQSPHALPHFARTSLRDRSLCPSSIAPRPHKASPAPPPAAITLRDAKTGGMKTGDMPISLANIKEVKIPLKPVSAATVMVPGMSAEINPPASILCHYDVLVDFPDREFTVAQPGALKFKGISGKILINAGNGLIQVPSQIENKKYNLALDLGASISFLSEDLYDKLQSAHPDWPHMTGAVGPANMWGQDEEPKWKLLRVDRLQYGPLYLTSVPMADFSKERMSWFEKRAGAATIGLLGSDALLNYRVGLDYAHATVYFDIGSTFKAPDFDVIGFTLRPEDDGRFTILGIADLDGKPSVPGLADGIQIGDHLIAVDGIPVPDSTMGQVWSLLEGTPGQERKLTVERNGNKFDVVAHVQHFLGEVPDEKDTKKKSSKKN